MTTKASAENKAYVVFFTKEGCSPCERMKQQTLSDPEVVTLLNEKLLLYEAEYPAFEAIELSGKFEVKAFPTLLVFGPKGVKIGEMIGGQSATSLVTFFSKRA